MVDPAEYIGVKMRLHVDVLRVSVVKVDEVATSSRLEELDGARIPQDVVAYELDLAAPSDDLTHADRVEFALARAARCKSRTRVASRSPRLCSRPAPRGFACAAGLCAGWNSSSPFDAYVLVRTWLPQV